MGLEVARSKTGLIVGQQKYVIDLLTETGLLGCKLIDTSMEQNKRWNREIDSKPTDREIYQNLVGKLIYLAHTNQT